MTAKIIPSTTRELQIIDFGVGEREYKLDTSFRPWTPNLMGPESLDEAATAECSRDKMFSFQYLRSPSSSSSVDGLDEDEAETRVKSASPDRIVQSPPAPAAIPSVGQEQLSRTKDNLRIRQRVNLPAPRLILCLSHPKSTLDAAR